MCPSQNILKWLLVAHCGSVKMNGVAGKSVRWQQNISHNFQLTTNSFYIIPSFNDFLKCFISSVSSNKISVCPM